MVCINSSSIISYNHNFDIKDFLRSWIKDFNIFELSFELVSKSNINICILFFYVLENFFLKDIKFFFQIFLNNQHF